MHVVIVTMRIDPDRRAEFLTAIDAQATASIRDEPGCLRFDVLRSHSDPDVYVLYEIYADEEAFTVAHRATSHYAEWAAAADRLLAAPRTTATYAPALPRRLV